MDGGQTGTVNNQMADITYRISADISNKGGKDDGTNNTRRTKIDDDTLKTLMYIILSL